MKGRNFEKVEKVCLTSLYNLLIVISTLCQKYNIILYSNSCDSIHNHDLSSYLNLKNKFLYILDNQYYFFNGWIKIVEETYFDSCIILYVGGIKLY